MYILNTANCLDQPTETGRPGKIKAENTPYNICFWIYICIKKNDNHHQFIISKSLKISYSESKG